MRFFLLTAEGAEAQNRVREEGKGEKKLMQVYCSLSIIAENRVSIYN